MTSGKERFQCVQCEDSFRVDYKFQDRPLCLLCAEQTGLTQRKGMKNGQNKLPVLQDIVIEPYQPSLLRSPWPIEKSDGHTPQRLSRLIELISSNQFAKVSDGVVKVCRSHIHFGDRILKTAYRTIFNNWLVLWLAAGFVGGGVGAFCGASLTPLLSGFSGIFHSTLSNVIPAMFAFCFSGVLQGLALWRLDAGRTDTVIPWCLAHCYIAFIVIVIMIVLGTISPVPGGEIFLVISKFLTNPSFGAPLSASLGSAFIGFFMAQNPGQFGMGGDGKLVGIVYGTTTFFGWLLGWGLAGNIISDPGSFERLSSSPLMFGFSMAISGTVAIVFFGGITIYLRSR